MFHRKGAAADRPLPARLLHEVFQHGLDYAVSSEQGGLTAEHVGSLAFDSRRNAYMFKKLPFAAHTFEVDIPTKKDVIGVSGTPVQAGGAAGRPKTARSFIITVQEAATIDLDVLGLFCSADRQTVMAAAAGVTEAVTTALQALEVLLRHEPTKRYKVHGAQGRRFFDPSLAVPIANGAEIWKGFFASVRPTAAGLVVNIDVAFSAFLGAGELLTVISRILGRDAGGGGGGRGRGGPRGRGDDRGGRRGRGGFQGGGGKAQPIVSLRPDEVATLRKHLRSAQLRVTHRPTSKVELFKGFTPRTARETEFTMKDRSKTNVVQYFKERYVSELSALCRHIFEPSVTYMLLSSELHDPLPQLAMCAVGRRQELRTYRGT